MAYLKKPTPSYGTSMSIYELSRIETPRLLIRPIAMDDAEALYQAIIASIESL